MSAAGCADLALGAGNYKTTCATYYELNYCPISDDLFWDGVENGRITDDNGLIGVATNAATGFKKIVCDGTNTAFNTFWIPPTFTSY